MSDAHANVRNDISVEHFGYTQELKRVLTLRDLIIYGLIITVPIAPFNVYGFIVELCQGMVPLVYIFAGIGILFTANSYARMSEAFPLAGSAYTYASKGINKIIGFLVGWSLILSYIMVIPLVYLFGAWALKGILPEVPIYIWVFIIAVINTTLNYRGIELTAKVNKYVLAAQLIVLAWFVVACVYALSVGINDSHFTAAPIYNSNFSITPFMAAVSIAILCYVGTDSMTTLAEETKGGSKTIGIAIFVTISCLLVLFAIQTYLASALTFNLTFSNPEIAFYQIAKIAGGTALEWATTIAAVLALSFACALALQAGNSRLLYGMSRDKLLPKIFCKIHHKYQTPYISLIFIAICSVVIASVFGGLGENLTLIVNFGFLGGFFMTNISTIAYFMIIKKSKNYLFHLVCPLIGAGMIGYIWWGLGGTARLFGFGWIAIGVMYMVYLKYVKKVDLSFASDIGL